MSNAKVKSTARKLLDAILDEPALPSGPTHPEPDLSKVGYGYYGIKDDPAGGEETSQADPVMALKKLAQNHDISEIIDVIWHPEAAQHNDFTPEEMELVKAVTPQIKPIDKEIMTGRRRTATPRGWTRFSYNMGGGGGGSYYIDVLSTLPLGDIWPE